MFPRFVVGFLVAGAMFAAEPVPCSVQVFVGDTVFSGGGGNPAAYEPGQPLNQTRVQGPRRMLTDSQGRLYFFNEPATAIYRTTPDSKTEVVVGRGIQAAQNGAMANQVQLGLLLDMGIDAQDRLYFSSVAAFGLPTRIFRVEPSGQLTVVAGGGIYDDWQSFGEQPATEINFMARTPLLAVTPTGLIYFYWGGGIFEIGLNGFAHIVQSPNGDPLSLASDSVGRLMVGDFDGLFVYDDPAGQASRPLTVAASQATAANNAYFVLFSPNSIARVSAGGRITDFFPFGSAFAFENGAVVFNAALPAPSAIATNAVGDLFIADSALDRIFVMRNADSCLMERPYIADVLNGASYATNTGLKGFSPGELVSVFGDFLGGEDLAYGAPGQSGQGTWQTEVGGLEVFVDDKPAPVIFSRADQAAFVIPNEVEDNMHVRFRRNGLDSSTVSYSVLKAFPGLFTVNSSGGGQAAALNQDSSINSPSNPAAPGSVIVLYLTGAGLTNPPSVTGSLNDFPLPQLVERVEVTINGVPAIVEFAGPAPGLISGVVQVNARIPADTPSGPVEVSVKIGGFLSLASPSWQPVTI
ncbi:MAG: hypothetical protein O3A53_19620 [Acidobacteria bacterium]|nr:hypothetical protein [Acidobacteriota bacterium]MDA1236992.1 hypothetical protein [Acidobacteriota bacterium]